MPNFNFLIQFGDEKGEKGGKGGGENARIFPSNWPKKLLYNFSLSIDWLTKE